jgi:hypothetical protein
MSDEITSKLPYPWDSPRFSMKTKALNHVRPCGKVPLEVLTIWRIFAAALQCSINMRLWISSWTNGGTGWSMAFTTWSMNHTSFYFFIAFVGTVHYYCGHRPTKKDGEEHYRMSFISQMIQGDFMVVLPMNTLVTVFWLVGIWNGGAIAFNDATTHITPLVFTIIDFMLNNIWFEVSQAWIVTLYLLSYGIATMIYRYTAGSCMYGILCWDSAWSAGVGIGLFATAPMLFFVWYGLTWAKMKIAGGPLFLEEEQEESQDKSEDTELFLEFESFKT